MSTPSTTTKILILAANPIDTSRLRLDEEVRDIQEGLRLAKQRDQFQIEQRWAVRHRDLQRALLKIAPQIVHFSGHGSGADGLICEDDNGKAKPIESEALAGLFELFSDSVECVLLNGCYTKVQADAIAQHIPYVIGMTQTITDRAAIEFAVGFYDALGAGRSIDFAHKLGCNAIHRAGSAERSVPILIQSAQMTPKIAAPTPKSEQPVLEQSNLTAEARDRLKIEQQEIQTQLDAINEEIEFLQQSDRTDDLSPKGRLLVKRQTEAAKVQRQTLNEQIAAFERRLQ